MSDGSRIEWTDATWNTVTGCTKVSPGCDHCYAETFAERWRGTPGHHFEHGFDVTLRPERLGLPLRWRRPRMVFANSMSDLFHPAVPDGPRWSGRRPGIWSPLAPAPSLTRTAATASTQAAWARRASVPATAGRYRDYPSPR